MIRQRLFIMWVNSTWQHATRVLVKGVLGLMIVGAATTPVVVKTVHHKQAAAKHVTQVAVTTRPVSKPVVKPQAAPTPPPVVSTPTPTPAPVPVSPPKPIPIPATQPTPGSGAKTLTPAPPTSDPGTSGQSSSSSGSSNSLPPATGGYHSTNWAGYVALAGNYTAVSGSWVVPAVTGNGTSETAEAAWIGIGGVFSGDLIQTGTESTIEADGTVSTAAFYELLPSPALLILNMNVSAGDSMSANIAQTAANTWQISISDTTKGQNYSTVVTYVSSLSTAEWIEEDPSYANGSQVPYANFNLVSFVSGTATRNGTSASVAGSSGQPITMVSSSTGQPVATPSVLASNGLTFNVVHN
jgi:hypothetical protein